MFSEGLKVFLLTPIVNNEETEYVVPSNRINGRTVYYPSGLFT